MVLSQMANRTECDQIAQGIVTKLAPLRQMMYVQIFRRTAILTAPSISFEHKMAVLQNIYDVFHRQSMG